MSEKHIYFLDRVVEPIPFAQSDNKTLPVNLNSELTRRGQREWDLEGRIGQEIYTNNLAGLSLRDAADTYLGLSLALSNFRKGTQKRSDYVINNIILNMAERMAIEHSVKPSVRDVVHLQTKVAQAEMPEATFAQRIQQLRRTDMHTFTGSYLLGPDQWFAAKLKNLLARIDIWEKTYGWFENMHRHNPNLQRFLATVSEEELLEGVTLMKAALIKERNRGVASGSFRSPLFFGSRHDGFTIQDETLGIDITEKEERLASNIPWGDILAVIEASAMPKPTDSPKKIVETTDSPYARFTGIRVSADSRHMGAFRIGKDGTFYTNFAGQVPLEQAFKQKNITKEGAALELFLLMRLYDLTHKVPLKNIPSITEFEDFLTAKKPLSERIPFMRRGKIGKFSTNANYRTLLFSRIDNLEEVNEDTITLAANIRSETQEEISALPKGKKIIYEKRLMPVSATLRKLREGYQASKTAQANALEYFGLEELPEGWTFVSKGLRETLVRINPETNEPYWRRLDFRGKQTNEEKLNEMIAIINEGRDPRERRKPSS